MTSTEEAVPTPWRIDRWQAAAIAGYIRSAKDSEGAIRSDYVALARMDPGSQTLSVQQIAALTRALHRAKLECGRFAIDSWRRWGFIAHGMALTIQCAADESKPRLGQQFASAGVSEARVTRLLNARGDAFFQILPRVFRLLASRDVAPNWVEFGTLILNEGARSDSGRRRADKTRIGIVQQFTKARLESERKQ